MTIRIEFPADRTDLAEAFGDVLLKIAGRTPRQESAPPALKPDTADTTAASADVPALNPPADAPPVDNKGVPKDLTYCANAKDPFYTSGRREGQWKRRQGVAEADYDKWYAGQLAKVSQVDGGNASPSLFDGEEEQYSADDLAAAFGASGSTATVLPRDVNEFMAWVSTQTTEGTITKEQVNNAFNELQIPYTALSSQSNPQDVAHNIKRLVEYLTSV